MSRDLPALQLPSAKGLVGLKSPPLIQFCHVLLSPTTFITASVFFKSLTGNTCMCSQLSGFQDTCHSYE